MRHMYSHPGEYRKIFLANHLCIGFVPGGRCRMLAAHIIPRSLCGKWQSSAVMLACCARPAPRAAHPPLEYLFSQDPDSSRRPLTPTSVDFPSDFVLQRSVLRRVLRRGSSRGCTVKKGSEKGVLRRGSEKGVSRRCLERPLVEYPPLGVRPAHADKIRGELQQSWSWQSVREKLYWGNRNYYSQHLYFPVVDC